MTTKRIGRHGDEKTIGCKNKELGTHGGSCPAPAAGSGRNLGITLSGATGGFEAGLLLDLLMSLLGMLDGTEQYRTTYIGITGRRPGLCHQQGSQEAIPPSAGIPWITCRSLNSRKAASDS